MQVLNRALLYRGEIKGIIGIDDQLIFVTILPENQPSSLYFLNAKNLKLQSIPLPCGGLSLTHVDKTFYVAGNDGFIHKIPPKGVPFTIGNPFPSELRALAPLAGGRLAVACEGKCYIVSQEDGRCIQEFELSSEVTALSSDPTRKWLAVGTDDGGISVFQAETQEEFTLSESQQIHNGTVTTIIFDQNDLRFYSTGTDLELYSTYARGKLEPENRGRSFKHSEPVRASIFAPNGRFYTGGEDEAVKAWPSGVGTRPVTLTSNLSSVTGLAYITIEKVPHLAVVCDDSSIRIFELDAEGKFQELTRRADSFLVHIKQQLSSGTKEREAALKLLAEIDDATSIEIIAKQMNSDPDHELRTLAIQLLTKSKHPKAPSYIESALQHNDRAVRMTAFRALLKDRKFGLRPMELALKTGQTDISLSAIEALRKIANEDDQALAKIEELLNAKEFTVRKAALNALEKVYPENSPTASLKALRSEFADLRRLGLIRLYQRNLVTDEQVQSAARRSCEDRDDAVRQLAFLILIAGKPSLRSALIKLDPDMKRLFDDLDHLDENGLAKKKDTSENSESKVPEEKDSHPTDSNQDKTRLIAREKLKLSEADLDPLLQATASRSLDTCLRATRGLAVLGDPRVFPLLLQLSREENASARADVCRTLGTLDDSRAISRLRSMLFDSDTTVRDAAFTALLQIYQSEPLLVVEIGLNSPFEEIRLRALGSLIEASKARSSVIPPEQVSTLLLKAVNDTAASVRLEAFKNILGLKINGGGEKSLRFAFQSIHADIRKKVLMEALASFGKPWVKTFLIECLDDPDSEVRKEAYDFWLKKDKQLDLFQVAVKSKYSDIRLRAVEGLIRLKTKAAQEILTTTLNDPDLGIRSRTLKALIDFELIDHLAAALSGTPMDVRIGAANALANLGSTAGLKVFLEIVHSEPPKESNQAADWTKAVVSALDGLNKLGDPSAFEAAKLHSNSNDPKIRAAVARMIIGTAHPSLIDEIRPLLKHQDQAIKYSSALALTLCGDVQMASLALTPNAEGITNNDRLAAALSIGSSGDDYLSSLLDSKDSTLRDKTLIILILLELFTVEKEPKRLLSCLSALNARVRLTAAQAIESYSDAKVFEELVVAVVNNPSVNWEEKPTRKIKPSVVLDIARLLAFGSPQARYRTILILDELNAQSKETWDHVWAVHARRFSEEIKALSSRLIPSQNRPSGFELNKLAFGAYMGLVREQGESRAGSDVIRIRQSALSRLVALAQSEPQLSTAAQQVIIQTLNDPNQTVRTHALKQLQTLNASIKELANEALATGYTDLAMQGLELLTKGTSPKEGEAILEREMLVRTDNIAQSAAKLLIERKGIVPVAVKAISAVYEPLRTEALGWLHEAYSTDPEAQKGLRSALSSRYIPIKTRAAIFLGLKKDPTAFDALVEILNTTQDSKLQIAAIDALVNLGDKRVPSILMDRLENDPTGNAKQDYIISKIGELRDVSLVDRLLNFGKKIENLSAVTKAVFTISGFDQPYPKETVEDPHPDRSYEKSQYPRHGEVLAKLVAQLIRSREFKAIEPYLEHLRVCRTSEVDPVLNQLTLQSNDVKICSNVLEAIAWRARFRNGPVEPLIRALQNTGPNIQFLAAEGLALAKRAEGLSILQSAIEYLSDDNLRRRAVHALGILGDKRTLDLLLKLARQDGHSLQGAALRAIGRMGQSEKGDEIFNLLTFYGKRNDSLSLDALIGLQWFNTPTAWEIIRSCAMNPNTRERSSVIKLLASNNEPATRDSLLQLITTTSLSDQDRDAAYNCARNNFGNESLEPDFAILKVRTHFDLSSENDPLYRILNKGTTDRIISELFYLTSPVQEKITALLSARRDIPIDKLSKGLESQNPHSILLTTRLMGGIENLPDAIHTTLIKALNNWTKNWETTWQELSKLRASGGMNAYSSHSQGVNSTSKKLSQITDCVKMLCWINGRNFNPQVDKTLSELSTSFIDVPEFAPIRRAALEALAGNKITPDTAKNLASLVSRADVATRTRVMEILGQSQLKHALKLLEDNPEDHDLFRVITKLPQVDLSDSFQKWLSNSHSQSHILTTLIANKDIPTLSSVANDSKQPESIRLGAIEGLIAMGDPQAEKILRKLGNKKDESKTIRNAAKYGARRSMRYRTAIRTLSI
jgi:ParB family chromosome partitioning protein